MKKINAWYKRLSTISRMFFALALIALFNWLFAWIFNSSFDWLSIVYYSGYAFLICIVVKLRIHAFFSWMIYWLVPFFLWNIASVFIHHNFEGIRTLVISLLATFAFSTMLLALSEAFKLLDEEEKRG